MMTIERVEQRHRYGCTAAAVAMVLGKPYDEVQRCSRVDFNKNGYDLEAWFDYLFQEGFVYHRMNRFVRLQGGIPRAIWPPLPFAPVHICIVTGVEGGHAVVMLADGSVLDPSREGPLTLSDYFETQVVYGFWRRP
jgi:hypothetical protein